MLEIEREPKVCLHVFLSLSLSLSLSPRFPIPCSRFSSISSSHCQKPSTSPLVNARLIVLNWLSSRIKCISPSLPLNLPSPFVHPLVSLTLRPFRPVYTRRDTGPISRETSPEEKVCEDPGQFNINQSRGAKRRESRKQGSKEGRKEGRKEGSKDG